MDPRKRGLSEAWFANGGIKKAKQETDSISTGVGSKSKPCTKFFSPAGCPFGEGCHFLHYVPGGYSTVSQMMNLGPALPPSRTLVPPPSTQNSGFNAPLVKSRLCNKVNTAEGCRFGDKCRFAHSELELRNPVSQSLDDRHPRMVGGTGPPTLPVGSAASFGASATAKISVAASLAGAIIGKGGVNSKQISRVTGARLSIRDHEGDLDLKNIELEGSFEQIKEASGMVGELIRNLGSAGGFSGVRKEDRLAAASSNYKTKMCENFSKGSCTFGERCHFAHGAHELRETGM